MVAFHKLVRDFPSDYFLAKAYLPFIAASGRRLDEVRLSVNMAIFAPLVQSTSCKPFLVAKDGRMVGRRFRSLSHELTFYSFGQHVGMEAEENLVAELCRVGKDDIEVHKRGVVKVRDGRVVFWPTATILDFDLYRQKHVGV